MKKDLAIIFGLFLIIIVLVIFGHGVTTASFLNPKLNLQSTIQKSKGTVTVSVRTLIIDATVANTATERKKGFSKRDSLPLNQGMLFVFEQSGKYGFWMKDMKFAIDILWLDEGKKIVDIAQNVPTEPDKKDKELTIYKPSQNAKYVLEVNAGLSQLHGLQIGDQAIFEL